MKMNEDVLDIIRKNKRRREKYVEEGNTYSKEALPKI